MHKDVYLDMIAVIGLLKERPILGDHPKAHIHEIRRISKDQLPGMVSPMLLFRS